MKDTSPANLAAEVPDEVLDKAGGADPASGEAEGEAEEIDEEGADVDVADGSKGDQEEGVPPEVPGAFEIEYGRDGAPERYQKNIPEETELLDYILNFERQFHQLYTQRKRLFICPPNEYGVPKFVATTVRPTQLPFKDLLDHTTCSAFVADYITYEPLEEQTSHPEIQQSPTATLALNRGNAFDCSILLCSLLIGAGYDAYVVVGYGAKDVTLVTEGREECPLLIEKETPKVPEVERPQQKYSIKSRETLDSKFLATMKERKMNLKEEARVAEKQEQDRIKSDANQKWLKDSLHGLRVHAWVLVLAGKRAVPEAFFIEASSGKPCGVTHSSYLGIEAIFNNENYWVNMQDCSNGTAEMSFNMQDPSKFEYTLHKPPITPAPAPPSDSDATDEQTSHTGPVCSDIAGPVRVPPSWVMRLNITEEQFRRRRPRGQKITNYKECKLEQYSEYIKDDGLVMRLTIYDDRVETKGVAEIREVFANRKDKLAERTHYPRTGKVQERFLEGCINSLMEHTYYEQSAATSEFTMKFYSEARVDGLIERVDTGSVLTETYKDRDDGVTFVSCVFDPTTVIDGWRKILCMTQQYAPNTGNATRTGNIKEESFDVVKETARLVHHLTPGAFAVSTREYTKSQSANSKCRKKVTFKVAEFNADPLALPLASNHQQEEKEELDKRQELLRVAVRDIERETKQTLEIRGKEEASIQLLTSCFDAERNQTLRSHRDEVEAKQEVEEDTVEEELDYLAPYLIQIDNPNNLSHEDAAKVRSEYLKDLKNRLIEKANRIQARFDSETAELQKRQNFYNDNRFQNAEEEEMYVTFCNDAMFRIHVLEQRLNQHKELAPKKYEEAHNKLSQRFRSPTASMRKW